MLKMGLLNGRCHQPSSVLHFNKLFLICAAMHPLQLEIQYRCTTLRDNTSDNRHFLERQA